MVQAICLMNALRYQNWPTSERELFSLNAVHFICFLIQIAEIVVTVNYFARGRGGSSLRKRSRGGGGGGSGKVVAGWLHCEALSVIPISADQQYR